MKNRIVLWACVGFFVAACWGFYFARSDKGSHIGPLVSTLASLSQPIAAAAASYLHTSISLSWFLVVNAVTYALIGLIVERLRLRLTRAN